MAIINLETYAKHNVKTVNIEARILVYKKRLCILSVLQ